MNKRSVSLWGFVGTVILTTLMAASQELGLSRINFPFMLGTMFTPNRDRAGLIGFVTSARYRRKSPPRSSSAVSRHGRSVRRPARPLAR